MHYSKHYSKHLTLYIQQNLRGTGVVAHFFDPSFWGGWGRRITKLEASLSNIARLCLKKNPKIKRSYEVDTIIILFLETRELRHTEVKQLAQGHIANK